MAGSVKSDGFEFTHNYHGYTKLCDVFDVFGLYGLCEFWATHATGHSIQVVKSSAAMGLA